MDERWIVQNLQHELIPILTILLQNVIGTSNAFIKCPTIEQMSLEIRHVPSNVMRQLTQVSPLQLLRVLVGPHVMLERMMDQGDIQL